MPEPSALTIRAMMRDAARAGGAAASARLFQVPAVRAVATRLRERATAGDPTAQAVVRRLSEADIGGGRTEDVGWRSYNSRGPEVPRLSSSARSRALGMAASFYRANPLARRMTDILRDFVVGDGLRFDTPNESVATVLREHWADPVNLWPLRQFDRALELFLFGEVCWPVFRAKGTGLLRIATVYPGRIRDVLTDPDNAGFVIGVELDPPAAGREPVRLRTVLQATDEALLGKPARAARKAMRDGECFYFAVNALSDDPRGVPDLLPVFDWLQALDRAFENADIRQDVLNAFAWDVEVTGATKDEITALQSTLRPPPPGGLNLHSEKQKWNPQAPDTKATDADTYRTSLIRYILTAKGYPLHWVVDGGDANLATAAAMDAPIMRTLRTQQGQFIEFVRQVLAEQVRSARAVNRLGLLGTADEELAFTVKAPPVTSKDLAAIGLALNQVVAAMSAAESYGYVDPEVAEESVNRVLAELGVDAVGSSEGARRRAARAPAPVARGAGPAVEPDADPDDVPRANGAAATQH